MKIENSNILLNSKTVQTSFLKETEVLSTWSGGRNVDVLNISEEGLSESLSNFKVIKLDNIYELEDDDTLLTEEDKLKIKLLEEFITSLTGKKFRFMQVGFYKMLDDDNRKMTVKGAPAVNSGKNGWGVYFSKTREYYEKQNMNFSANGTVKTKDGKEIKIEYNMDMTREFYSQSKFEFSAGDAVIDPIVIDYDGSGSHLTKEKYSFDLDFDGKKDQISFLEKGSGFLAYDKNGNNQIDDGTELFGPRTGSGFSELAEYDDDGNGWIDENDEIFDKLRIWNINDLGEKELSGLGEKGIGAIYLKSVSGNFEFKDSDNNSQGVIKKNSIFLKENGVAGAIHEIDLVV